MRALLVDRDAALLQTDRALADVAALPTLASVEAGYGLLQVLAARPQVPCAGLLAVGLRLRERPPQARSELDAWRTQVLVDDARLGMPVVLATEPFWSSAEGRQARASAPSGWILGAPSTPVGGAAGDLLRGRRLDRALAAARLVVLLAGDDESPVRTDHVWMRGLALGDAVVGTRAAFGFAALNGSPAVLSSAQEAFAASAVMLDGEALAPLRLERAKMLERLGLSAQRTPVVRCAA